jgi:hypothetical protein
VIVKLLHLTDYIYYRKLVGEKWMINIVFHLKRDINLLAEIIYNSWLIEIYLKIWDIDSTKEIILMIKFTSKAQLIQINSFGLEKDGNYNIFNGKRYIFKMDKSLNNTLVKDNILMIVKDNSAFNQLVYFCL